MPDGSFNPEAGWAQQGPADALVRSLVRQRRGGLGLSQAVNLIRSAGALGAFPSIEQWETCGTWPAALAQTSAEEAVKRAGGGNDGHWCGGIWSHGPEKDCQDSGHRSRPSPDEARRLTETLIEALGDRS